MSRNEVFHYQPSCSAPGCPRPAVFKIAAQWSDGTSSELKSYGLACESHRQERLAEAQRRARLARRSEDEVVGPIEVYHLDPVRRDADLQRFQEDSESTE